MQEDPSGPETPAIAYTLLRPPWGAPLIVFGVLAGLALALFVCGAIVASRPLALVAGVLTLVFATIFVVVLATIRSRIAPMVRLFAPYRGLLQTPRDGEQFNHGAVYRADDHIGCILFNSKPSPFEPWFLLHSRWCGYWNALKSAAAGYPGPLPRSVVDARLRGEVSKLPLTADLLEPEPIVTSPAGGKRMQGVAVAYVVMSCAFFASGKTVMAISWLVAGAVMGLASPRVRKLVRPFRWESKAPVAGCGVVKSKDGRRWTIDEAIMLLQARGGDAVHLTLIGPAGVLRLTFSGTADPDFVTLWERWNHLNPRPDLLE